MERAPAIIIAELALTTFLAVAGTAEERREAPARPTAAKADWTTPAEVGGFRTTPRYDETMAYLRRIAAAAPRQVKIETFGKTGEGRDLVVAVVSRDGLFDPGTVHGTGRPVVLIQNAIHAGEMDGKDACLMLLRDMVITGEKARLLDRAVLLIIPIYNADGHERFGPHNRINQNGPEEIGWRTQARNLNLNRDYMKADAPETRAFLRLWNRWLPDLFVDTHVTDGADYQYDTTYGLDTGPEVPQAQAEWRLKILAPYLESSVAAAGQVIGPFVALKSESDPAQGMVTWQSTPRFSTGYMILQNRTGVLVETHMLKDYRTRVLGTYHLLRALLEVVNKDADTLVRLDRDADAATIAAGAASEPRASVPLRLEPDGTTQPFRYRGIEYRKSPSPISGAERIEYLGRHQEITIPRQTGLKVTKAIAPPRAYIVPAEWTEVIDLLEAHGLRLRRTTAAWEGEVETYRCDGQKWAPRPYEGRQVLLPAEGPGGSETSPGRCVAVRERLAFPTGSAVVPLDQRAARVAIHLLEPEAPDSIMAWGFVNAIFEQKEYAEAYVMEKLAPEMLARDPALKAEFEARLASDKEFAASPQARLDFFYRRSPWWDRMIGLYPVGRLASLSGLPLKDAAR